MKRFFLSILFIGSFSLIFAQRNVNLRVNLLSPLEGAQIEPMETFPLDIQVINVGSESLLANDSLAVYLIMNGDTIPQMSGNYWVHTNFPLASQQTGVISKLFAFDNSLLGAHIDFCVFVKPYNAADPVTDLVLTNNKSCAGVDVVEEVNSTNELLQEAVQIFPNPVQNTLSVSAENVKAVAITDQTGKIILENPSNLSSIDCSSLQNGIYFVRVKIEKGEIMRKIVKK